MLAYMEAKGSRRLSEPARPRETRWSGKWDVANIVNAGEDGAVPEPLPAITPGAVSALRKSFSGAPPSLDARTSSSAAVESPSEPLASNWAGGLANMLSPTMAPPSDPRPARAVGKAGGKAAPADRTSTPIVTTRTPSDTSPASSEPDTRPPAQTATPEPLASNWAGGLANMLSPDMAPPSDPRPARPKAKRAASQPAAAAAAPPRAPPPAVPLATAAATPQAPTTDTRLQACGVTLLLADQPPWVRALVRALLCIDNN
jgi:hypothetical protein